MKLNEIKDKGELKFNLRINNDGAINVGHEIKIKQFTNSETGLSYQISEEPNSITKLFAIQEGEELFDFEGINLNFKKK